LRRLTNSIGGAIFTQARPGFFSQFFVAVRLGRAGCEAAPAVARTNSISVLIVLSF
jgi:hypothetical protein